MTLPSASRPATLPTAILLSVALVAGGVFAPSAFARQPPAGPPPVADTPEAQAERDLAKLGEEKAREHATRLLTDAYRNWDEAPGRRRSCDQEAEDLRYAIRYYARAHGLPASLDDLADMIHLWWQAAAQGLAGSETTAAYVKIFGRGAYPFDKAVEELKKVSEQPCPEPHAAAGTTGASRLGGRKAAIIGGAAAGAGAVLALAAGGGGSSRPAPATTPPATQPPDVTSLHGTYTGRLVTAGSTISGCGRAATAPCNATLGGSANGTPATVSFGGDLPSTGVLRASGTLESFTYQGPANGLGALPAGTVIQWQQQGSVTNGVLRLEGRATVTSAGACNGAVIPTTVEATKN
jgi:hypothetical protein